jgi:hypothetical protein
MILFYRELHTALNYYIYFFSPSFEIPISAVLRHW